MHVERTLQILMGLLAALGTILLGMGQRNLMLPALMVFAVVTSIVFTDSLGWFRLHRAVANLAAIVAVVFSLSDFLQNDTQRQLLSIAHLLIYLQVVLLYQRKSERIYWQLAVLSLLQVVVAAALNVGFEFGVVLVAFTALAFLTLAVFFVHRTGSRFPSQSASDAEFAADSPAAQPAAGSPGDAAGRSRYGVLLGTAIRAEPQIDREEVQGELMSGGFGRHVLGMALATLVFTVVFFYCTPRTIGSAWRGGRGGQPVVGFSNEIELNELGRILQNNEQVMRVHFFDAATGAAYEVFNEPYFRGMVLTLYSPRGPRSSWSNRQSAQSRERRNLPRVRVQPGMVVQDVLMQPRREPLLFSVSPAYRLEGRVLGEDVVMEPRSGQLFRKSDEELKLRVPYRYTVATDAFRDGVQRSFQLVYLSRLDPAADELRLASENQELLNNFDPADFPGLTALAEEIVSKALDTALNPLDKARLLQNYLQSTERYRYTLDFRGLRRTPGVDPIEDFAVNHRSGHCEYFASALVMMLRSQGIPARIVVGYRGGELNKLGGYLQVRQNSAHAWVEAFIRREDLPPAILAEADQYLAGAWMRLDPTPSATAGSRNDQSNTLFEKVGQALDYAQAMWDDYVLGLSPERQQPTVFDPFDESRQAAETSPFSLTAWRAWVRQQLRRAGMDISQWQLKDWFSWRAGLIAMVLAAIVLVSFQALASAWKRFEWPKRDARRIARARRVRVDFYERLERLLGLAGLVREPHQTQREFVAGAARQLRAARANDAVRPAPAGDAETAADFAAPLGVLVERFYAVRFGARTLDNQEVEAIEQALARLETLLGSQVAAGGHAR
ncbi:MAG: DUF3488 domain-containing protein [Pirellulaceae bacterium]|nr:DUF3488 domain-containing protein [Pirellulaceae bacterium]